MTWNNHASSCRALACAVLVGLSITESPSTQQQPTLEASISQGSITCWSMLRVDESYVHLELSQTLLTPSGRYVLPTCGNSSDYSPLEIISIMDIDDWSRPGDYAASSRVQ